MSASARVFLDTNLLVDLFDDDAPVKQTRAREILDARVRDGQAVISTQVLQEFYVAVTRKLERPLPEEDAEAAVRQLSHLPTVQIDAPLVLSAIATSRSSRISLWDALILQAAAVAGCESLLSEDLHPGQTIEGVRVENPFV